MRAGLARTAERERAGQARRRVERESRWSPCFSTPTEVVEHLFCKFEEAMGVRLAAHNLGRDTLRTPCSAVCTLRCSRDSTTGCQQATCGATSRSWTASAASSGMPRTGQCTANQFFTVDVDDNCEEYAAKCTAEAPFQKAHNCSSPRCIGMVALYAAASTMLRFRRLRLKGLGGSNDKEQ